MKNRISHFWTTRPDVMMVTLSLERETHYLRGRFFPLWRKYSLQQQNCVQLTFRSFPCYGSNGIAVTFFFCFMHLLTILFVSLILTCLYLYVYQRSKLERKEIVSVTGVSYSWKTLKTSKMIGIVWRELNLRLAVSKDINRSVLVEKIITHRKRPFQVEPMDEEQKFMIGTRIGRYKPSGLRDLSRDRAIKEPYWGPLVFVHDM